MSKIIEFLTDYNIPYWDHHSIVSSNYIGLNCPFCHDHAKPYLGIRKEGNNLSSVCWRCGSHSAYDTVEALTGITDKNEVYKILKKYKGESSGNFNIRTDTTRKAPTTIEIPGKPILIPPVKRYLEKRGFDPIYLFEKYQLQSTTYENPSYRVIFPFLYKGRKVSWTARDFTGQSEIRYQSCPHDLELVHHKHILYNIDKQKVGGNILLNEGILDSIRTGGVATAGTSTTINQLLLLRDFKKVFIMFDGEVTAIKKAYGISTILSSIGIDNEVLELEEGEDPDTAFRNESDLIALKKDLQLY